MKTGNVYKDNVYHTGPLLVLHDTLHILTRQLEKFWVTQSVVLNGRSRRKHWLLCEATKWIQNGGLLTRIVHFVARNGHFCHTLCSALMQTEGVIQDRASLCTKGAFCSAVWEKSQELSLNLPCIVLVTKRKGKTVKLFKIIISEIKIKLISPHYCTAFYNFINTNVFVFSHKNEY